MFTAVFSSLNTQVRSAVDTMADLWWENQEIDIDKASNPSDVGKGEI